MPEIVLCRNIGVRVPSKCKNVFNTFVFEHMCKLVDLTPVIVQASKMDHRFDAVLVLDLFGKFDRTVAVG